MRVLRGGMCVLRVGDFSVGGIWLQFIDQNVGDPGKGAKDNAGAQEHWNPRRFREFWHGCKLVNECE